MQHTRQTLVNTFLSVGLSSGLLWSASFGPPAAQAQTQAQPAQSWGDLPPRVKALHTLPGIFVFGYDRLSLVLLYDPETKKWAAPSSYEAPLTAGEERAMMSHFAPFKQPIALSTDGRPRGVFLPEKHSLRGCDDLSLTVEGEWRSRVGDSETPAVGFSRNFPAQKPAARPVQPVSKKEARRFVAQWLRQEKRWDRQDFQLDSQQHFALESQDQHVDVLFVSGHLPSREALAVCPDSKFWFLAERPQDSSGPYTVKHSSWLNNGDGELSACGSSQVVSSFQLKALRDHLLIEHTGYEWWDYSVLQRQANGEYKQRFRGGGGGC